MLIDNKNNINNSNNKNQNNINNDTNKDNKPNTNSYINKDNDQNTNNINQNTNKDDINNKPNQDNINNINEQNTNNTNQNHNNNKKNNTNQNPSNTNQNHNNNNNGITNLNNNNNNNNQTINLNNNQTINLNNKNQEKENNNKKQEINKEKDKKINQEKIQQENQEKEDIKSKIYNKLIIQKDTDKLKYEFMPSALEIAESPPSPLGKTIIIGIFIIMLTAILYSIIGQVDQVAIARGKVIPNGKIKVVQSLEEGIITAIYVDEGERVQKDQLLIELDSSIKQVDKKALQTNIQIAKLEKTLLEKYLKGQDIATIQDYITNQDLSQEIKQNLIEFTKSRKENYQTKKQTLELIQKQTQEQLELSKQELNKLQKTSNILTDRQIQLKNIKEKNTVETINIEKIQQNIKILKEEEQKYKQLADQGAIPKQEWQNKYNQLQILEKEYKIQKAKSEIEKENNNLRYKNAVDETELNKEEINAQQIKILQNETKLQEAQSNLNNLETQEKQETLNLIVEKQKQIENLNTSLEKANKSIQLQSLTSPTNGIVQGISLNTIGGVVSPAQSIMSIVPENTPLIIEAILPNKDIGFVKQGQKASIKIDTFSFQKYGTIQGIVEKVSPDAFEDENLGLVYKIKVKLDKDTLMVEGEEIKISPGMSVTVEIKTGTRRIIEFFLEPLIKHTNEALKLR